MKEKVAVSKRLSENIAQMEEFFHECDDIKKKELMLGRQMDVACYLTFIEVSVDMGTSALSEVLKYLKGLGKEEIYQALEQNALGISDATYFDTIEDAVDGLLTGEVILFVDGFDRAVKIPDDGYPNMGITEADSEKVIRGSNEGFCDSVKQNAALIRKRIRSPKVKVKQKKCGMRSNTNVYLVFMEDLVYPGLVREIRTGQSVTTAELKEYHDRLYAGYREEMDCERDALFKMKEVWFYLGKMFPEAERELKKVKKAERPEEYLAAVRSVFTLPVHALQ